LLAAFALFKKLELDESLDQRKKIANLQNLNSLTEIYDSRDDFRPYIIKALYFLIGNGNELDLREKVYGLFRERLSKSFSSFETM
jgi:hypothetical protein